MSRYRREPPRGNALLPLWIGLGVLGGIVLILFILLLVTMDSGGKKSPAESGGAANSPGSLPIPAFGGGPLPVGEYRATLRNAHFEDPYLPRLFVEIVPKQGRPDPRSRYFILCARSGPGGPDTTEETVHPDVLIRGGRVEVKNRISYRSNHSYQLALVVYNPRERGKTRVISNHVIVQGPKDD